ncbi:hypothetical protein C3R44_23940, partial [Mycobacterium tuberculosis]
AEPGATASRQAPGRPSDAGGGRKAAKAQGRQRRSEGAEGTGQRGRGGEDREGGAQGRQTDGGGGTQRPRAEDAAAHTTVG